MDFHAFSFHRLGKTGNKQSLLTGILNTTRFQADQKRTTTSKGACSFGIALFFEDDAVSVAIGAVGEYLSGIDGAETDGFTTEGLDCISMATVEGSESPRVREGLEYLSLSAGAGPSTLFGVCAIYLV